MESAQVTDLSKLLATFRQTAASEREKGIYFERLVKTFLQNEPYYADLYAGQVWLWEEWRAEAAKRGLGDVGGDAGIDLVAQTTTGDLHAIQAKFYDEDARLTLKDLSTFLTAAGRKHYAHGLIFLTATKSTGHLREALRDQKTPVSLITLHDLESSRIDWAKYQPEAAPVLKQQKALRPHQDSALKAVIAGLKEADRGKLIMACGTGKTFTSLKIAETMAGKGGRVLFLVPSLSLLSQSLTEWTQESTTPLHSFAVCSDVKVGKRQGDDDFAMQVHELQYPATTDARHLAAEVERRHDVEHMTVVFATYHSIEVLHQAQGEHGLADFDLIVCDEAHRTTGATFEGEDESAFVRVHDAAYLRAAKRLYMTATPRIYGNEAKAVAERDNVALYSMDNEAWYGRQLFVITFSEAVKRGLLVDYKVIVLAVEESHINRRLQNLLKDENNTLRVDDAAKIVGCWKALAKLGIQEDGTQNPEPMRRAVAFCQVIEPGKGSRNHKVSSKEIAGMFQAVVEAYQDAEDIEEAARLTCEAEHVDGGMNAAEKEAKLDWLKAPTPPDTCRVLSNVRCLSEGVDVPALDAVLFLTPRNSQVDVVQSVGRVMRNAPGKKRGYVVLPVVIPAGVEPHEALNDNQTYKVVWQVLQALRSHDDRFDAMVNKLELVGPDPRRMEVVAITDNVQRKAARLVDAGARKAAKAKGKYAIGKPGTPHPAEVQGQLEFEVGEIERALYAKVVEKCGNRHHWEDWANDIAKIAQTHIDRINALLEDSSQTKARQAFDAFAHELRDDLNDKVSDAEIVEMLAQHLITKPVFDALFADYSFASHNPMSQAMQQVLDVLDGLHLGKEADTLTEFYASVKLRAEGIDSAAGKQKIVVELYDKFFRNAFPRMTERLGIVYTPVEVVDFILHSVNHLLQQEFGQTLGSKGVHILDPFTGTGTFITRLLQSGLIKPEELAHKYRHEIHANELVLLAYYIAAINIEATYHTLMNAPLPPGEGPGVREIAYEPFPGICLTDTFQMYEKEDLVDALLVDNSQRRKRQKKLDIRVIVGNPPYSVGQGDANANNANVAYPSLDARIRDTYAARSDANNKNALYDSYIRAIRWASDRIGNAGVIGFVTNAGFVEANTADGLRKCLAEEFSSLYVFHLRGNQRTSGETSRKEGGKIFGSGSRAPIAISLLVKNPEATQSGQIHFHDIGDYLSREDKLEKIETYASVAGIPADAWQAISPDEHGDWLKQRDDSFGKFIVMGDKDDKTAATLFDNYTRGLETGRDAWVFNSSEKKLRSNIGAMISFYNSEVDRFALATLNLSPKDRTERVADFINTDGTKISWTRGLRNDCARGKHASIADTGFIVSLYRPFTKQAAYFDRMLNAYVNQLPRIFPDAQAENLVIGVSAAGEKVSFSALISQTVPSLHLVDIEGSQCFPLYLYDEAAQQTDDGLFAAEASDGPRRRDAITDAGLAHFQSAYPGESISKQDLFYYVYGLLHSPAYRERYADNLSKELPRIPRVRSFDHFRAFSQAGRDLAALHLNYETVGKYPLTIEAKGKLSDADYRVEKMKFAKKKDPETGKSVNDRSTVIYNSKITLSGIPEAAWDYVVNGKAALDWVMERQAVRVDKASGIVNDANDWAIETMGDPKYPLELFQRVVTVSLETLKIVNTLPALDVLPD